MILLVFYHKINVDIVEESLIESLICNGPIPNGTNHMKKIGNMLQICFLSVVLTLQIQVILVRSV